MPRSADFNSRAAGRRHFQRRSSIMGKGNNSQKNDKKNKKPKQDKKVDPKAAMKK
jgi:hypothetical protein